MPTYEYECEQCGVRFERLQRMGNLHAVGAEYFIQTTHLLALAVHAWELAQADPHQRLNVKALRERTGISRHLSVPLVEYFDQIGLTRRDEVGRHFRRDPRLGRLCDPAQGGWRFIKFRHLRWLVDNPLLSRDNLDELLAIDPLTYSTTQLRLL